MIIKQFIILSIVAIAHCFASTEKPNIILINVDDLGYGDLSCYGSEKIKTPHLDQMASEGRKFTDFMNASSVCTPSRAALMTGCYPKRVGMEKGVIFPKDTRGLHPDEVTIADILKSNGYATYCIGKWHLGHELELLPTKQGFDYYYGIPYSNDMMRLESQLERPDRGLAAQADQWKSHSTSWKAWDTPLLENEEVIEAPVDQRTITRRYTDMVLEKIEAAGDESFFVYLAHSMPHLPLYLPDELWQPDFEKSYQLVVEHIDAEVGRIFIRLKESGLDKNTYVFFTSDNGPSTKQLGSALPLKGKKFSNNEGGHRVPFIAWAPGKISAGTQYDGLITTMDLLPTLAKLSGATLDQTIKIDGNDVTELLIGDAESPTKEFLYYNVPGKPVGIRQGEYKLLLYFNKKTEQKVRTLYNLKNDVSEKVDIINANSDLADTMESRMRHLDKELSQNARSAWTAKK